ncbi:MAG: gamma-glutamyltransferase [Candidatus Aminicenantes bacterium]|nr:gamma-glutamyltransferase [Candidatus Aminicenantes bacterium]
MTKTRDSSRGLYWFAFFILMNILFSCQSAKLALSPPPADPHQPYEYFGQKAMVVAAHPLAVEAGLKILKAKGNAVDAAVATAAALNVAEPFASGIGGGGFMIIYLAEQKKITVINFREKAPARFHSRIFTEKGDEASIWRTIKGTAVGVPGALAGWDLALQRYGTKKLAEVLQPAIEIAEHGFSVSKTFSDINKEEYDKILTNAGEKTVYLKDGLPYEPGDFFQNPELAKTFRLIAQKGIKIFYQGEIASQIVKAVQEKDGLMTLEDLANYRATEVEPLKGQYRKREIYTIPPPGSGLHLLQLLNVASFWPLSQWGRTSARYLHHLTEAMRLVFADRETYLGDPDFFPVPSDKLLAFESARFKASLIKPDQVLKEYYFENFNQETNVGNTTHLCVLDEKGNAVALTQSINHFFGSGIVPEGTGFLLNNHMDDFASGDTGPNAPGPGRRPASSMAPLFLFEEGKLKLILGSPGGLRIFPTLAEIIINIIDFGLSLDEAIEAPRFFSYSQNGHIRPLYIEPRFSDEIINQLESFGHKIIQREPYDRYFGGAQGIMIEKRRGLILGGADSRRDGFGQGY